MRCEPTDHDPFPAPRATVPARPAPLPRRPPRRRTSGAIPVLLLAVSLATPAGFANGAPRSGASPGFAGVWQGLLLVEPRAVEVEFTVELARTADGRWVGTYDQPDIELRYRPFDRIEIGRDGAAAASERLHLALVRSIPQIGREIHYSWEGRLAADGTTITGTLTEGDRPPRPFRMERIGPPGTEPARPAPSPVLPLAGEPGAPGPLVERFNDRPEAARLLLLLSPDCSSCLAGAGVVQRYVLETIAAPDLAVHVVWGPMLGHEEMADAPAATRRLPDQRTTHYWTDDQDLARRLAPLLGMPEEETAWDTYLLFPPGAVWGELPPAPATFMHLRRGFPDERRLDGERLAREIRELLPHRPGPEGPASPGS